MPFRNRYRAPGVLALANSVPDREHDRTTSRGRKGSRNSPTLWGMFRITNVRRKRFAMIWALAAVVYLAAAAQSAWAVTPLTGEGVTGAGKSTGGSASGSCSYRYSETGSMGFSASGTATVPYPGSFSETGSFSLSGYRNPPWTIHFSAAFTIKSGNTTITGSFASPTHAWWGVGFICNSAGGVSGYSLSGPVTYTATINGQTFQGTGSFTGTLYAQSGATDSVSESVTVSYGQITGVAIDSATSAPIAGICVKAYNSSGGVLASAQTNSSGAYTLSSVPTGSAQVGFSSGCGTVTYLTQYYNAKPSLASANAITVPAGGTASGINAAMLAGGQITGTVTASATKTALAAICVQAYNSGGVAVASSQTNSSGVYTLSALPTGSYQVGFMALQREHLRDAVLPRKGNAGERRFDRSHRRHDDFGDQRRDGHTRPDHRHGHRPGHPRPARGHLRDHLGQ